jgi:hypothetical protein
MVESTVRCPSGLRGPGKRLWAAVNTSYELDEHELVLLREAVRVVDLCHELQGLLDRDGPVLVDAKGSVRTHPALVELRQERLVLARLIVALRVPIGVGQSSHGAPRLQYRGLRGVQSIGPGA